MSLTIFHTFALLIFSLLSVDGVTQDFYWRDYIRGDIPYDAIEGAPGRYIGQVNYNGNHVATIFSHNKIAAIEWVVRINFTTDIKILCSPQPNRFYWEYVDFTKPHDGQMREAVKGGYQSNLDVSDTYIGKVMHENEWKIGKVVEIGHPTVAGIWVWNNVNLKTFHLLKYNLTSPECNKRPTLVCGLCG